MSDSHFSAVRAFHAAIGAAGPAEPTIPDPATIELRRTLLHEEYTELLHAIDSGDLTAIAGEAIDLLYVTYGLCVAYGIDADAVFNEVQRANLAKTAGPRRPDGKQLKPAGWTPPDIAAVLARQQPVSSQLEAAQASPPDQPAATGIMRIEIMFDGGADPNPGQGYGSYRLTVNGSARAIKRVTFPGRLTNNEAEYNTLIAALEDIHAHSRDLSRTTVEIKGDSSLVINQINGTWKAKDARMAALRNRALLLLNPLGRWSATWHDRSNSVRVLGH
jgi:predicted HAD superfamily Cof-like phosphohydrolase/ribonuclease HI